MSLFKTYQEWKRRSERSHALEEADKLLSENFFVAPIQTGLTRAYPPFDPVVGDDSAGSDRSQTQVRSEQASEALFKRAQIELLQVSEILFRIDGLQRLYQRFEDQGASSESQQHLKKILKSLFELARIKLQDSESALFKSLDGAGAEGSEEKKEAPEGPVGLAGAEKPEQPATQSRDVKKADQVRISDKIVPGA